MIARPGEVLAIHDPAVERIHQDILDRRILATRHEDGERHRKHVLFDALDQSLLALLDQLDVLPDVLDGPAGHLGNLLVRPAFIMQVLQLAREFHRAGPAARQVLDQGLKVCLLARACHDLRANMGPAEALVSNQAAFAADQFVTPGPGEELIVDTNVL